MQTVINFSAAAFMPASSLTSVRVSEGPANAGSGLGMKMAVEHLR